MNRLYIFLILALSFLAARAQSTNAVPLCRLSLIPTNQILSIHSCSQEYNCYLSKEKTAQLVASVKTGKPSVSGDCWLEVKSDGTSIIHLCVP